MKTIEIKYNVNDEVWIYLAGEITKAIVTRIKYSESISHRPILLYEVKEMDKGFSEWTWREEAMKKFCKGGKKSSNKVLDYFGVKKKIYCESSIDPVTELK